MGYLPTILPQAVAKLPLEHNILQIQKIKDIDTRFWYTQQCLENGWGRETLDWQIKNRSCLNKSKTFPTKYEFCGVES